MKVILLTDVNKVGKKDQVVEVKEGYGRNFLLARKLAVEATDANLKELNIPDYASSSAVKIGAALKDAAIQHRQEKRKLDEAFARKRESLLSQLTTTKERET